MIARIAAHNPSTSRIKSEAALNPSLVEKKVHRECAGTAEKTAPGGFRHFLRRTLGEPSFLDRKD